MLLALWGAVPAGAQVSDNNEDGVNKVPTELAGGRHSFVPGQVIVKFRDGSPVEVRQSRGRFKSASAAGVSAVLRQYGAESVEKLFPREKHKAANRLRVSKSPTGETIKEHNLDQVYIVQMGSLRPDSTLQLVSALDSLPDVEYAEPNYIAYISSMPTEGASADIPAVPTDAVAPAAAPGDGGDVICANPRKNPYYSKNQWGIDFEGLPELWQKPIINAKRPVIAIIDTGVDLDHPDLKPNLWTNSAEAEGEAGYDNDGNGFAGDVHGWDFVNNSPNIRDYNNHGTHCAGIAAAADNEIGVIGANPKALIMPVTVMQSDGTGDYATIVKGINYAVANGATVLSMSFGGYTNSRVLREALENAYHSAVLVAAAGNDWRAIYKQCADKDHPCYGQCFPAAYSFVLGVQALAEGGSGLAGYSNFDCDGPNFSAVNTSEDPEGFNYEVSAPGSHILSTVPGGNYRYLSGTSMATPLVAGAVSALQMVKEYNSQEMLWADITHSATILEAYNIAERPAEIDFLGMQMRDRHDLTDGEIDQAAYADNDGEADAGETLSIWPIVRTTFGDAKNIKLHLAMGDEYEDSTLVDFITPTADFGMNLTAYGKGVSVNPLKLKISDKCADARHIKLKVIATADGTPQEYSRDFTITVNNIHKIGGIIDKDTTLTADKTWYVNKNLGIPKGVTLTIEPGARLEFGEGLGISSLGHVVAHGTPGKPIVFTNHAGNGYWSGIRVSQPEFSDCIGYIYRNADSTKFTFVETPETPIAFTGDIERLMYLKLPKSNHGQSTFFTLCLNDYLYYFCNEDLSFLPTDKRLSDPNFITPTVHKWIEDVNKKKSNYVPWEFEYGWNLSVGVICWHYILNAADTAFAKPEYGEDIYDIYTNEDSTKFTFKKTDETPIKYSLSMSHDWFYNPHTQISHGSETLNMSDYIVKYNGEVVTAFAPDDKRLTDPSYLTPAILNLISDVDSVERNWLKEGYFTEYGSDHVTFSPSVYWRYITNALDDFTFCKLSYIDDGYRFGDRPYYRPYYRDCEFSNAGNPFSLPQGKRNNVINSYVTDGSFSISNFVNNRIDMPLYISLKEENYFNNYDCYHGSNYWFAVDSDYPTVVRSENPSYLGTAREDLVRPHCYEMGNAPDTYGKIDLSNMLKEPIHEAHGIVWKVVVDGKDAQDEYEQLPPLGVGRHEFCVWFNRPMNVAKAPQISFGVRSPYSQIAVAEDGSWSADSTKYTAYVTITGKTSSDGINQIYVRGAEDNEYFECPYENTRFRVQVQAAGSLATGFEAEPGLGKVSLKWNNENNDFSDAMGFNVYRYEMVNDSVSGDTLRLNREIIDADSVSYTDFSVTAGKTYYYYYKVLSTDLKEYDVSNVVAAKVLTGERGDANGSGNVDVADVITTVNYSIGDRPKPFLFEAADMNADNTIDVLDVVGIIEKILGKDGGSDASAQATATYSVEGGKVWVNSPVALAGVQVMVKPQGDNRPTAAADLDGFEQAGAWIHGDDYVFLGYNVNGKTIPAGKHAILDIGDEAEVKGIVLSDPRGKNVNVEGEITGVNQLKTTTLGRKGIYTTDGVKVEVDEDKIGSLPHGVYIINGNKVLR